MAQFLSKNNYFPQTTVSSAICLDVIPIPPTPDPATIVPKNATQVREISYAFPTDHEDTGCPSVVCRVTLDVLGFPCNISRKVVTRQQLALASRGEFPLAFRSDSFGPPDAGATTFGVSLRDSGTADFLIPEKRYEESIQRDWKLSERVMLEWKEEEEGGVEGGGDGDTLTPFYGYVEKVAVDKSGNENWPNSPWDCLSIKWDMDESTSLLGPWEPRPVSVRFDSPLFLPSCFDTIVEGCCVRFDVEC